MPRSRRHRSRVFATVLLGAAMVVATAQPSLARPVPGTPPVAVAPSTATGPTAADAAAAGAGATSAGIASAWHTDDLGAPVSNVDFARVVGAVSLQDSAASVPRPYMFNVVAGALWMTSQVAGSWRWTSRGAPAGSPISGAVGVIKIHDQWTDIERPYVFVHTADGRLWGNWWDGSRWAWTNIGTPGTSTVRTPVGAVAVQTSPGGQAVPYVFVIGADGHLWWAWLNTVGGWNWTDQGVPPGATLAPFSAPVGAVNLRLAPTQRDLPQAFALDTQGRLWRNGFDGTIWRWYDHGARQAGIARGVGVVAVQDGPNAASRPSAYVSVDGILHELAWVNGAWVWSNHSGPGVTLLRHAGAIAVQDGWDTPQRPYVFTCGQEGGALQVNWWTGAQWRWTPQPGTDAAGLDPSCADAVALPDRFTGIRNPYVFYWSRQQPMRLMLYWWG